MRICFISHSAYMGGAERALLEAVRALTEKGVNCTVLLPYKGPLAEELKNLNIAFRVAKYRPWVSTQVESRWLRVKNLLISLAMAIPTSISIIRWRSTIVWTNTLYVFTGAVAAFLTRRPHIWHIHEFGVQDHGFNFLYGKRLSFRLIDSLSALVIANSRAVANACAIDIPPSKIRVIYQSVSIPSSPSFLWDKKPDGFWCILVGRLSAGKRQEDAIRALAELARKGIRTGLYLLGDGSSEYLSYLTRIVNENGIEANVKFLGYRDDAFAYMHLADVVLMCSRSEAFGRVTIEGMLAGKPVIGSRSGATPELIQDGVTGLIYEPRNYKQLAQKIEYLYANPERTALMGQQAKEWAMATFGQARYGDDLIRLLSEFSEVAPNSHSTESKLG